MKIVMKRLVWIWVALLAAVFMGRAAQAGDLQLSGKQHWLTVASSKDKNVAIGIARQAAGYGGKDQVVSSASGYYAVILGPYEANSIEELKKNGKGSFDELPKDALLSQGANYLKVVWSNEPLSLGLVSFSLAKAAEFSVDGLQAKVIGQPLEKDTAYVEVTGTDKSGANFNFDIGKDAKPDEQDSAESYASEDFHKAGIARLTKDGEPQIIVTQFSGGAHCCTSTWIMSRASGAASWAMIEGDTLDGDGYWVEDLEGDGALELMSVDNSFLYAFDSYAGSFAPITISRLEGGKIEDVTDQPQFKPRLAQDLAGIEFQAKSNPDLWRSNGFLVGWLASKMRLGQGDEAWAKFMANYDKKSGFGPQICTTGQKIDDCPADKMRPQPIPEAVAEFLNDKSYGPLPKAAQALLKK